MKEFFAFFKKCFIDAKMVLITRPIIHLFLFFEPLYQLNYKLYYSPIFCYIMANGARDMFMKQADERISLPYEIIRKLPSACDFHSAVIESQYIMRSIFPFPKTAGTSFRFQQSAEPANKSQD